MIEAQTAPQAEAIETKLKPKITAERSVKGDLFARVVGFVVFAIGVGIILKVLLLGFEMFQDPNLGLSATGAKGAATSAADVGIGFGKLVLRIALLFLGSISGSLVATKGINLYFTGAGLIKVKTDE